MSTGTITGTSAVSGSSPTRRSLQNIRRLLARTLNSLTVVTTTSAGAVGGTSIIATRLANAIDASRYLHSWWMPVDGARATEIRRVKVEDALNLSTGELQIAPAFSGQVASGVIVEGHRLLPPDDDDGWTGLRTCINRALSELWTTQRLSITGVDGQPSYSLSTHEEWLDPDAVTGLLAPAVDGTTNPYERGGFTPIRSGDSLTLQVAPTLATGDAALLEVFRESGTFIRVGGVWGASTTGLVNDSDEQLHHPELVVRVALAYAYEALASGPDGSAYSDKARLQRRSVNLLKLSQMPHDQRGLEGVGSVVYGPKDGFWGTVLNG